MRVDHGSGMGKQFGTPALVVQSIITWLLLALFGQLRHTFPFFRHQRGESSYKHAVQQEKCSREVTSHLKRTNRDKYGDKGERQKPGDSYKMNKLTSKVKKEQKREKRTGQTGREKDLLTRKRILHHEAEADD
jgi:hypothetical protein